MRHNTLVITTRHPCGQHVRVLTAKQNFKKEGATYNNEVYTVASMEGNRFVLKDEQGLEVKRRFSAGELLKVKVGALQKSNGHVVMHAAKVARVVHDLRHKECIAKNQAHAEKIIKGSKSKSPIAAAVKNKRKIKTVARAMRSTQQKHACTKWEEMR